jgi:hypothetical protein
MGRTTKVTDAFAAAYPNIARWIREEGGWIELGSDEFSSSFIRVLDLGGMVWEGKTSYSTIDAAFADAEAGIAEWLDEDAFASPIAPASKKSGRGTAKKKQTGAKLVQVDSSMLIAIGYDEVTKELEAVFHSGAVWRYRGVPKKVYRELLAADSKGSYMRSQIIGVYSDYQVRR